MTSSLPVLLFMPSLSPASEPPRTGVQWALQAASFVEHRGPGEEAGTHVHSQTCTLRRPHTRRGRLPSAVQPPTSRTTRRPTGPTTEATPGPQAGTMLGSRLRPPTSALEGDGPPGPSRRGLSVRRDSVCRDNGGAVRGERGNPGGLRGGGRRGGSWGWGKGLRDNGGGSRGAGEAEGRCVSPHIPALKPTLRVTVLGSRAFGHKGGALGNGISA